MGPLRLRPAVDETNSGFVVASQALMVAYVDDFKLMMIIIIVALPLLLLFRRPRSISGAAAVALD